MCSQICWKKQNLQFLLNILFGKINLQEIYYKQDVYFYQ